MKGSCTAKAVSRVALLSTVLLSGCTTPLSMSEWWDSFADDDFEVDFMASDESGVRYCLSPVGSANRNGGFADLGAIAFVSNDTYWAASDSGGFVCELTIPVDRSTGRIVDCRFGRQIRLEGCRDVEGLVFDPLASLLWVSDESTHGISGHRLKDGVRLFDLSVPDCYSRSRSNLSLESLTLRENGLEMWTCNEATLDGDRDPNSTALVRLTRFVRTGGSSPWRQAGQWAYPIGRIHGGSFRGIRVRGVAELCVLPDGTLLSLEREFSWKVIPCFRCRIYQIYFSGATDVSGRTTLTDSDIVPVRRRRLWVDDITFSNYEGMCLGPSLDDGSRLLLIISDGDDHANENIYSFRLDRVRGEGAPR